jgi:hypothetical protein
MRAAAGRCAVELDMLERMAASGGPGAAGRLPASAPPSRKPEPPLVLTSEMVKVRSGAAPGRRLEGTNIKPRVWGGSGWRRLARPLTGPISSC